MGGTPIPGEVEGQGFAFVLVAVAAAAAVRLVGSIDSRRHSSDSRHKQHRDRTRSTGHTGQRSRPRLWLPEFLDRMGCPSPTTGVGPRNRHSLHRSYFDGHHARIHRNYAGVGSP